MTFADTVNGLFESAGAVCIWMNVRALLRDRAVKGVYWPVTAFFFLWGVWNLWYYPSLDQWMSFTGGIFICVGNVVWLALAIKFTRGPTHE